MPNDPVTDGGGEDERADHTRSLTYEMDADEPPSEAVVRAVAALTGQSILDIEPLYDVVDPEHLDGIFEETETDAIRTESSFTFNGCEVTVTDDRISVRRIDTGEQS